MFRGVIPPGDLIGGYPANSQIVEGLPILSSPRIQEPVVNINDADVQAFLSQFVGNEFTEADAPTTNVAKVKKRKPVWNVRKKAKAKLAIQSGRKR
jgi:hypothetical protein